MIQTITMQVGDDPQAPPVVSITHLKNGVYRFSSPDEPVRLLNELRVKEYLAQLLSRIEKDEEGIMARGHWTEDLEYATAMFVTGKPSITILIQRDSRHVEQAVLHRRAA